MTLRAQRLPRHDALESVTPLAPEPSHAEAVRVRSRTAFVQRAARARQNEAVPTSFARLFVPVLLGAASAIYAVMLIGTTLRIERWLR